MKQAAGVSVWSVLCWPGSVKVQCVCVQRGAMGTAALLVTLTAMLVTVAGVEGQDGESIATSFLSGQFTSCFTNSFFIVWVWQVASFCLRREISPSCAQIA